MSTTERSVGLGFTDQFHVEPPPYAELGRMAGNRDVGPLGHHLQKAAEKIAEFKVGGRFGPNASLQLVNHKLFTHLDQLSRLVELDFRGVDFTAKGLKEINTHISTVLAFTKANYARLTPDQVERLRANMQSARDGLINGCVEKLRNPEISQKEKLALCAVLNQVISSMPECTHENVRNWGNAGGGVERLVDDIPQLAKPLEKALSRIKEERVAYRMFTGPEQLSEQTHAAAEVLKGGGKLRLSAGGRLEGQERAAPQGLKAKIKQFLAQFFGRVGSSKESQQASAILVTDIGKAFERLLRGEGAEAPLNPDEAKHFFKEFLQPLADSAWFQGTLKHNPTLRRQFEAMKQETLDAMLLGLQEQFPVAQEESAEELVDMGEAARASGHSPTERLGQARTEVEEVMRYSAHKAPCKTLIQYIVHRQAAIKKGEFRTLTAQAEHASIERLREIEEEINQFMTLGTDVSKECRAEAAAVLETTGQARNRMLENELALFPERIDAAETHAACDEHRRQITGLGPFDHHTDGAKKLAQTMLKAIDARKARITALERNIRDLGPFLADDFALDPQARNPVRDVGKFLRQANDVLEFVIALPAERRADYMRTIENLHRTLQILNPERGRDVNREFTAAIASNRGDWDAFAGLLARVQELVGQ